MSREFMAGLAGAIAGLVIGAAISNAITWANVDAQWERRIVARGLGNYSRTGAFYFNGESQGESP